MTKHTIDFMETTDPSSLGVYLYDFEYDKGACFVGICNATGKAVVTMRGDGWSIPANVSGDAAPEDTIQRLLFAMDRYCCDDDGRHAHEFDTHEDE